MRRAPIFTTAEAVEEAFHDAMQRADLDAMMSLWADDEEVVCVHPGGGRLVGLDAIRSAWGAIFHNGGVDARPTSVRTYTGAVTAVHSVVEQVEVMLPDGLHQAVVMATNVYHKTPEGWRLVAHHASPGVAPDAQVDVLAQRPVLH